MTAYNSHSNGTNPATRAKTHMTAQQLREEIEATRAELGHTVEQLAAKADVKRRVGDRTAAVTHQAVEKTPEPVREKVAETKAHLTHAAAAVAAAVHDRTPRAVAEKVGAATGAVRRHRSEVMAGVAAGLAVLMIRRRSRRRSPG